MKGVKYYYIGGMSMRRFLILLMYVSILFISACGGNNYSNASMLEIVEKKYSDDYTEAWIIAFDPNSEEQDNFKIFVDDFMVWNLIEENRTYFTTYEKKGENPWRLKQINHHDDYDAFR